MQRVCAIPGWSGQQRGVVVIAARIVLLLYGLMFMGFGVAFLLSPLKMASATAFDLLSPAAVTEMRAFYGGLEIGLGAYLLVAMAQRKWAGAALQALIAISGGIACGRLFGILVDGTAGVHMLLYLLVEVLGVVLGILGLGRLNRRHELSFR